MCITDFIAISRFSRDQNSDFEDDTPNICGWWGVGFRLGSDSFGSSILQARDLDIFYTILTHFKERSLLNKLNLSLLQEPTQRHLKLFGTDWLAVQITSECLYQPLAALTLWVEIILKDCYCVNKKACMCNLHIYPDHQEMP